MATFEEMFKDYERAHADVERERLEGIKKAEQKGDAERNALMSEMQAHPGDQELRADTMLKVDNSFGNEAKEIRRLDEVADGEHAQLEAANFANENERVEGTGLTFHKGAPPTTTASPVEPPPPKDESKGQEAATENTGVMRSLAGGAKSIMGDAGLELAAVGVALISQVQSLIADMKSAEANLHAERPAITRQAEGAKESKHLEEGDVPDNTGPREKELRDEEIEAVEDVLDEMKSAPAILQQQPADRMVTHVFGLELKPPPPPPPPPANENELSEGKTK